MQKIVALEMPIDEWDAEAAKQELAVLYAVPASDIDLAVAAGSLQLTINIRAPLHDASGMPVSSSESLASITSTVNGVSDQALSAALSTTVEAGNVTADSLGEAQSAVVSTVSEFVVGPGKWTV